MVINVIFTGLVLALSPPNLHFQDHPFSQLSFSFDPSLQGTKYPTTTSFAS